MRTTSWSVMLAVALWLARLAAPAGAQAKPAGPTSPKTVKAGSAGPAKAKSAAPVRPPTGLWPLPEGVGRVDLAFGPVIQPKLKREVFNTGCFIAAPENTPVLAVADGTVACVSLVYTAPDLESCRMFNIPPGQEGPDDLAVVRETAAKLGLPLPHLHRQVSLDLGQGFTVHYSGLAIAPTVKTGQKVKAGAVIGHVGHLRVFFDEPHIRVTLSRYGKPTDAAALWSGPGYVSRDRLMQSPAPYDPARRFPRQGLQEDLKRLCQALEEGHPGLYTYTDKAAMDQVFTAARQAIDGDLSEDRYVDILDDVIGAIRCNHTAVIRSLSYYDRPRRVLPCLTGLFDGQCRIVRNYSPHPQLREGVEITAVDGHPVAEVLARIGQDFRGDGFNTTLATIQGAAYLSQLYTRKYGDAPTVTLRVRTTAGPERELQVNTISAEAFDQAWEKNPPFRVAKEFFFAVLSDRCALMRIPSFEVFDVDEIRGWFKQLTERKVPNLILDLRDNAGGADANLTFLYSFFAPGDFQVTQYKRANTDGTFAFFQSADNFEKGARLPGEFHPRAGQTGFFQEVPRHPPQADYRYPGRVYVLINGRTQSAAAIMAGLLHRERGAVSVGMETGGGYYRLNGEQYADFRLQSVPLYVHFPLLELVLTEQLDPRIPWGHGLVPDHVVQNSYDDTEKRIDRCLEFTTKLIAQEANP